MKKRALVAVIIAAIAMMIGAQSTVVGEALPGTFTAQGKVHYFGINLPGIFPDAPCTTLDGPSTPARGPWQVTVSLNTHHVSFNAISQVEGVVYKVSYTGFEGEIVGLGTHHVTIAVPYVTVKSEETIWTSGPGTYITLDDMGAPPWALVVDIEGDGWENIFGGINHFRYVPEYSHTPI